MSRVAHNGLSWRTFKTARAGKPSYVKTAMVYSAGWQLLEEHIDSVCALNDPFTPDKAFLTIYGLRYIDDVLCRRLDANYDGDFDDVGDKDYYHLTDDQFSTVAVLDTIARLVERVSYDAYGGARHHWMADADGDGDVDGDDLNLIVYIGPGQGTYIHESGYIADADLNRDGVIDNDDYQMATSEGIGGV